MARDYARGVADAWNQNQMIGRSSVFNDRRVEPPPAEEKPKPRTRGGRGKPNIKTK